MINSEDDYYIEICNTLSDYNDRNNTPLSNANIREAIHKIMEGQPNWMLTISLWIYSGMRLVHRKKIKTQYLQVKS